MENWIIHYFTNKFIRIRVCWRHSYWCFLIDISVRCKCLLQMYNFLSVAMHEGASSVPKWLDFYLQRAPNLVINISISKKNFKYCNTTIHRTRWFGPRDLSLYYSYLCTSHTDRLTNLIFGTESLYDTITWGFQRFLKICISAPFRGPFIFKKGPKSQKT